MQPSQACRAVYCRECSLPSAAGRRSELAEFTCLFPLWLVAEPPFPAPIHFAFSSVLLNGLEKVTIKKKKIGGANNKSLDVVSSRHCQEDKLVARRSLCRSYMKLPLLPRGPVPAHTA